MHRSKTRIKILYFHSYNIRTVQTVGRRLTESEKTKKEFVNIHNRFRCFCGVSQGSVLGTLVIVTYVTISLKMV